MLAIVIEAKVKEKFERKPHLALALKKAEFGIRPKQSEITTKLRLVQNLQMASRENTVKSYRAEFSDYNQKTKLLLMQNRLSEAGIGTALQATHADELKRK